MYIPYSQKELEELYKKYSEVRSRFRVARGSDSKNMIPENDASEYEIGSGASSGSASVDMDAYRHAYTEAMSGSGSGSAEDLPLSNRDRCINHYNGIFSFLLNFTGVSADHLYLLEDSERVRPAVTRQVLLQWMQDLWGDWRYIGEPLLHCDLEKDNITVDDIQWERWGMGHVPDERYYVTPVPHVITDRERCLGYYEHVFYYYFSVSVSGYHAYLAANPDVDPSSVTRQTLLTWVESTGSVYYRGRKIVLSRDCALAEHNITVDDMHWWDGLGMGNVPDERDLEMENPPEIVVSPLCNDSNVTESNQYIPCNVLDISNGTELGNGNSTELGNGNSTTPNNGKAIVIGAISGLGALLLFVFIIVLSIVFIPKAIKKLHSMFAKESPTINDVELGNVDNSQNARSVEDNVYVINDDGTKGLQGLPPQSALMKSIAETAVISVEANKEEGSPVDSMVV